MWGDLESARGVWVTDVPALATRATPATGKAVSAAEGCAKALPKQDKQTTMSKKREATSVSSVWTTAGDDETMELSAV
jgi:hypothetical protein